MRYSRVSTPLKDLSLIASLDLEVAQFAAYDMQITKISVELHGGEAKPLGIEPDTTQIYKSGDQITHLYKIKPKLALDGTPLLGSKGHFLTLEISAQVFISENCKPRIAIEWRTPVDFTNERNPGLIRAAQRLSNSTLQSKLNPDALPVHDTPSKQEYDESDNTINITLTISGPPKVKVGEIFTWDTFIINRSDKPRRLAVLVIPKRKREIESRSRPTTASGGQNQMPGDKKDLIASAIVDENIIYARQKSAKIEAAELICLTTDMRLG